MSVQTVSADVRPTSVASTSATPVNTPFFLSPTAAAPACFAVRAAAEPGVLPRILELFAKRGLVPVSLQSRRFGPDGTLLNIEVQVAGLALGMIDVVAESLRQIVAVQRVLTAEMPTALQPAALQR